LALVVGEEGEGCGFEGGDVHVEVAAAAEGPPVDADGALEDPAGGEVELGLAVVGEVAG